MEHPVRQVKVPTLKVQEVLGEGLQPHEVAGDDHGGAVVGAVVIGRGVCPCVIPVAKPFKENSMFETNVLQYLPLLELIQPGCSLGSHRLGQVSEGLVTGQVQLLRVIVGEDPGEHRVLHQVIV